MLGEFLAPRYLISVEGKSLKEDVTQFIESVTYEEEENSTSQISIRVLNQDFRFLDERVFAEGNTLDLWMGYVGKPLTFMNRGIILNPTPNFPRSGIPIFNVVAKDISQNLISVPSKDRGKTYSKRLDSEIAAEIFSEERIVPLVQATKQRVSRTRKKGTNRWEFLARLAEINDYVVNVRYDVTAKRWLGYFGPKRREDQPAKYKFIYGTGELDATLYEFSPRPSLASQSTAVEVSYTDAKTGKRHRVRCEVKGKDAERARFAAAVGRDKMQREIQNGPSVTVTCWGQREEVIADRHFASPADAKRWASTWWKRRQDDFLIGSGAAMGSSDVRTGQVHELSNLGRRLSGDWEFHRVTHRMGRREPYEIDFDARKVALAEVIGDPRDGTGATVQTETL